ncbi:MULTISPECIES: DNA topoisomerase III [unclassified Modicisalibacter]|uniref:DNA topoisomerase III n=1 Tax=unclassified Modicisalibacter TaxID=2679913 RepID=UPI001CCD1AE9|nr:MULTISPECIES: DNA topoisomerase III [unclassified Modicisalibacter]MBZ9559045.1 DNA topoisomerase III [Modicisalibacter sp. R2A 31.J]MBZ9576844.1 DNA topoisomerase III [Modicisalibacter sp. MOD 31.J]
MTRLFLCEKPSQARDIGKVLGATRKADGCLQGEGVVVTWAFGHLLEQAPPEAYDPALKRWSLESLPIRPGQWKNTVRKDAGKQFRVIQGLLKQCSEVVVSTDADREGETIGREILDACRYQGRVSRLWLSALDEASIRKALANIRPGESTWSLYQAGLGRSRADWLVGMNLTRAFSVLAQRQGHEGVLSVGRVQTPTLALVVRRDQEIASFVPKPFWDVVANLQARGGRFQAKWLPANDAWLDEEGRCIDQEAARAAAARCQRAQATVASVETSRKREAAPLVMDLGTLQQACSKHFGFGAQQVLDIAQSLYETHKATTYPRTDCRYLPTSMLSEVEVVVTALLHSDDKLAPVIDRLDRKLKSRVWNDRKITAHHGIIPTTAPCRIDRMSEDEFRVYDLIRRHYLAQFLPAHEYDQTDVRLDLAGETFVASGRQVRVEGWKLLFPRGKGKGQDGDDEEQEASGAQALPPLRQGESCAVVDLLVKDRQTQPPKPFAEGTLISAMKNAARFVTDERLRARLRESAGIGTEATRAGIIETLLKRGFIRKKGRTIVSTPVGQGLIAALPPQLSNPGMTALWEQALDQVAEGSMTLEDFMQRQHVMLDKLIALALQQPRLDLPEPPSETCPKCSAKMRKRKGGSGPFWSCSRYPECDGTKSIGKKGKPKASGRSKAQPARGGRG